jgi:hypothetical protein
MSLKRKFESIANIYKDVRQRKSAERLSQIVRLKSLLDESRCSGLAYVTQTSFECVANIQRMLDNTLEGYIWQSLLQKPL